MNENRTGMEDLLELLPAPFAGILSEPLAIAESFAEFAGRFADETGTVALLSGGGHDSARFHVLGLRPWLTFRERAGKVTGEFGDSAFEVEHDPFDFLQAISARYRRAESDDDLPLRSGLLGYLAYDLKDVLEVLPRTSRDDLLLPRLWMAAPSILVVHDRRDGSTTVHLPVLRGLDEARSRLAAFRQELTRPAPVRDDRASAGPLVSGLDRGEYMQAVEAVREYIRRGHVYQVNMSQRFETGFQGDPYALFSRLFVANPAPFFSFLQAGDHQLACTSPERFVELRGRRVETRPIKGTRPRGRTPEEDEALRRDLETSFKDDSELSMIVDLLRNDIGKVCAAGSVRVLEHKRVEAYENVHHLVSVVEGILDAGMDAVDLVRATFPGGSITGCPKIRAMEVIDELEPVRRHVYTGSIGYIGFGGTLDLNIAIRTATIAGGRLVYSVGGGVVYDSDPADEYEETLHKGRTISNALERLRPRDEAPPPTTDSVVRWAWSDGKFLPLSGIAVPVEEEGFAYGYGFFETLRVQDGRILRLDAHLRRFRRAWERFLPGEFPDITWKDVIDQVLERSGLSSGVSAVKLLSAAGKPGSGSRGNRLLVTARPYVHRLHGIPGPGLRLSVYPHGRQSPLFEHKTMNYMLQRDAANWAKARGADEAILLNADGTVSETNTANLIGRIGGRWVRPFSTHVLPGTFEEALLAHLAAHGEEVVVRPLRLPELSSAEALFATNALMGIVPIASVDGAELPCDTAFCEENNTLLFA